MRFISMVAMPPYIIDLTGPRVVYVIPDEQPNEPLPQASSQMQQAASATVEAAEMLCVLTYESSVAQSASSDTTPTYSPLRPSEDSPLRIRLKRRLPPVTPPEAQPLAKRSIAALRPASRRPECSSVPTPRRSSIEAEKKMHRQLLRQSAESYAQYRRELRDKDYNPDDASDESCQRS